MSDGPTKELKEEDFVYGSDEEANELPEDVGSDEDLSDSEKQMQEELEGSVDEESTKFDEEFDDLAIQEKGYLSNNNEMLSHELQFDTGNLYDMEKQPIELANQQQSGVKCKQNFDLISRSKMENTWNARPLRSYSSLKEKNERPITFVRSRRSLSIPPFIEHAKFENS